MAFAVVITTFVYVGAYGFFYVVLPIFFRQPRAALSMRSVWSLAVIAVTTVGLYLIALSIPDPALGNRFLHAIVGGFVASAICYLAATDSGMRISRFQFFAIAFLIVTALGVANEILEFGLQTMTPYIFAENISDTWLDLVSNTVGGGIGALFFARRIPQRLN